MWGHYVCLGEVELGENPKNLNSGLTPKNWHVALFNFIRVLVGKTKIHGQSCCSQWWPAGNTIPSQDVVSFYRKFLINVIGSH